MRTTIKITKPTKQDIDVTCTRIKDWDTYLVNIYTEESYPGHPERKPIGEEVTIAFNTQVEVEKFIALIRKATKKIK